MGYLPVTILPQVEYSVYFLLAKERFTAMIWIGVHVPIELPTVDHANDGQRQTQRTKAADGFTGTEMVNGRLDRCLITPSHGPLSLMQDHAPISCRSIL